MVSRLILSLVFDLCEAEGDAEGLRALRRVMVPYFLSKSPQKLISKYASFTLLDLVVEMSESERNKKRMDLYVTVNPSGTPGGGLFRDKFEEHCVRSVNRCLKSTQGGIDDIKLEKEIGGLSVITDLERHNRQSVLRVNAGKVHSHDMIGQAVRDQVEENVSKYDPFNKNRKEEYIFYDKPCGGVFSGLTEANLTRFVENKKREFMLKSRL